MPKTCQAPHREVAVGLVRVSSSKQEFSAEDQEAYIRKWAKKNDYELLECFVDQSMSGSNLDRPGLNAMFAFLEDSAEKGVLVAWKRNRLLRDQDPRVGIVMDHRVEELGWRSHFLEGHQKSGNVFLDTIAEVVEHHEGGQYLVNLSRDTLRGAVCRIEGGAIFGGVIPYGYAKEFLAPDGKRRVVQRCERHARGFGERGQWIPGDPVETRVVLKAFGRYATGQHSLVSIAQELNRDGLAGPRGRPWTRYAVRSLIQNPTYKGDLVWNRSSQAKFSRWSEGQIRGADDLDSRNNPEKDWIRIESHHEPLVSKQLWEKANLVLNGRGRAQGGARNVKRAYPLRGLLTCANCGALMCGEMTGAKRYRYPKYVCPTWGENRGCKRFMIRREALEGAILLKLKGHFDSSRDLSILRQELLAAYTRRLKEDSPVWDYDAIAREAKQLKRRVTQATKNLGLLHGVAAEGLASQINEWGDRLEELRTQLAEPKENPLRQAEEVVDRAVGLLEELEALRADSSPERLRALFQATVDRVELRFGRRKVRVKHRNYLESGRVVLRDWTSTVAGTPGLDSIRLGPSDRIL